MKFCHIIALVVSLALALSCVAPKPPTTSPSTTQPPTSTIPTTPTPTDIPETNIIMIDAHSQIDEFVDIKKVIQLMDRGGIARVILSSRGKLMPESVLSFAADYPERILPAIRTKGYMADFIKTQVNVDQYAAMAEVLMYHAGKGQGIPLVRAYPDDPSVIAALSYAVSKEWPFVAHIEFAAAGNEQGIFMDKLKALLARYPQHPFVLIHMGQLNSDDVTQLIGAHENIYFITSWSNPICIASQDNQPWTNMFNGNSLSDYWKELIIAHPDRFILGFDRVFAAHWGQLYLEEIALWRNAISELPSEVAEGFAHGNAERLWHLPPLE